jgi:hypothetical protein
LTASHYNLLPRPTAPMAPPSAEMNRASFAKTSHKTASTLTHRDEGQAVRQPAASTPKGRKRWVTSSPAPGCEHPPETGLPRSTGVSPQSCSRMWQFSGRALVPPDRRVGRPTSPEPVGLRPLVERTARKMSLFLNAEAASWAIPQGDSELRSTRDGFRN